MWDIHDGMGWWMLFGWVWFVVFWGLVIWAVTQLLNRPGRGEGREDSALEIAKRRYARGEISREEFEKLRHDLGS